MCAHLTTKHGAWQHQRCSAGVCLINKWMSEWEGKSITGIRLSISWSLFRPSGSVILASSWSPRPFFCFPNFQTLLPPSVNSTSTHISSVQSLSCVWLFVTPWTVAHQAYLSFTNSQSLLKLMSVELEMPTNRLILWHPLLLLPSVFSIIRVFSNESVLHIRWPKYWRLSFSISPSNEYSGLISFRIDWFDLQGTLKSLLQHHNSPTHIHTQWCGGRLIWALRFQDVHWAVFWEAELQIFLGRCGYDV